jgi:microcystin-dependent protein
MTAITKAWVTIADSAVDPDSPVDQALMEGMRDNLVHLREWVGAGFVAGAVQDHDHDGVNSKPIAGEVGTTKAWPGISLPGANWDWCDGGTLLRASYPILFDILNKSATVTITIASPAVITWTNHGLRTNMPIRFFTTGALPTGITAGTHGGPSAGTEYFVKVVNANTFNIATTPGGANVNTSGSQSGTHTVVCTPHGNGDGSTTFHKPDYRGRVPVGRDDMGGSASNRMTSGGSGIAGNVPGRSGGTQTHTLTTTEMPTHAHSVNNGNVWSGAAATNDGVTTGGNDGSIVRNITTNNNGSGGAHQNTQPSIIEDWIIRIA